MLTLRSMALRPDSTPKSTIEVPTLDQIRHSLLHVEVVQVTQERERVDSTVGESRVDLSEGVTCEYARRLLE